MEKAYTVQCTAFKIWVVALPESKFSRKTQQAIKKFTDRIEPVMVFNQWLEAITTGKITRKVLVYYGVGGIGKTRLISKLMDDVDKRNKEQSKIKINIIFAGMDINEYNSPSAVLLGLRKQIKFPCVLFDYGLVKYFSSIGKTADQIKEFIPKNSVIWDITGDILEAIHIPVGLIDKIAIKLREKYSIQFKEYHNEIEAIDSCKRNPEEISERLPHLLGIDISIAAKSKNSIFAIFLDSYESIYRRQDFQLANNDPDEFIQELVLSSKQTLFIIGSREYIKWEQKDPSWNEILDQHILDYLSDQDSDYFLRSVPILDESIRKSIISSSKGLPLYLDLCVEIYLRNKNNMTAYDFIIPTNEIIPRFLSHLSDDERTLFIALSYIHFFNFNIFEILVKELNIPIAISDFDEIASHSFVLKVENLEGIYKVHDNFYEYVINNPTISGKSKIMEKIFSGVIKYLNDNKKSIPYESMVIFYPNVMNLLSYMSESGIDIGEKFIELSIFIVDAGYWNVVGSISAQILKRHPNDDRIQFLFAVYLRRIGMLEDSIKILENINPENPLFGNFKDYISYYKADTLRVMGRYKDALSIFNGISEKYRNNKDNEIYLKSQNQIGDITFLFGKFLDALNILESGYGENNMNTVQFAEMLRIEGHIYRFNFMLEDAIAKYFNSMELARKLNVLGLQGKLYNNLVEAYCWLDANEAIEYGKKSIEINKNLNAPVEYGKTYAALSIASSMKGDFTSSLKYSDMALSIQEQVKYPGGMVYAHGSYCLIYIKTGDKNKFMEHYNEMKKLVKNLGAEKYTMLPYYIYLNDAELKETFKNLQWLDYEKTLKIVKTILSD
ncbi:MULTISPECIES: tetratricopeptide repeat protein [unclassified Acidiplasma]|uniref:tetratricopeptide repeat protein n=1 Tax=unclassified Acidiplasma TaxID=2641301 RepID=UPI0012E08E6E|nr:MULTISPECIES: tetratricopeptide repeat protein [unclassified Acidiplasma]WMT55135.1 MAG: tetratricopeptide repeat protein [Acidiplasma sp.]